MGKLDGKIALVTGGNSGIGLATAERFAAEGATVFVTGRRQGELDEAVKEIGHGAVGVQGDVANLKDLDRLYDVIRQKAGRLDVVFANAGIGEFAKFGEVTEEHFDRVFGINVKGLLFTVQKALPLLPDGAAVILNASIVSIKALPAFGVYAATKAAVRSFARSWAVDLKDRKIRVNVVSPGPIHTPAIDRLTGGPAGVDEFTAQMSAAVPLGRVGKPDEIAKAVVYLASDDASYVNGVELFVDGGMAQI